MNDYSNSVLAVTGATGFVGTVFMKKLEASGLNFKEVRVLRSRDYDLRNLEDAKAAFEGADYVVHIAGITGGIEFTRLNQGSVYYDNIMMNTNVLHSAYLNKVKKVVSVGSVCSYPKFAKTPFKESEIWDGYPEEINAPYGMAKKMLIVQGEAYKNQYGLDSQVLLFTNLYGPGDHFDKDRSHVAPALIVKFKEAKNSGSNKIVLWGDGTPTRDLLYVEDAADSIIHALQSSSEVSPINVGSGIEVSIKELANTIHKLVGGEFELEWDTSKPNGQPRRILDTSLAEKEIGFKAKFSLREGLKNTIDWYEKNMETNMTKKF
ncbi:MAG: NAD-dependent epimerase/dehydratase family protein [Chitinophagales bacterium]